MWPGKRNPPEPTETLSERDSDRLRRLSAEVNDLTADFETILGHVERINARLRQRARRASEGPGDDGGSAADNPDDIRRPNVVHQSGISPVEQPQSESPTMTRIQVMQRLRKQRTGS